MSELIGKIQGEYKNILNQQNNIIDDFDVTAIEAIDFTPGYKPDEDEWFRIPNFSQSEYYITECNTNFSTASLNQIANDDYRNLAVIGIFQNNQKHLQFVRQKFQLI